MDSAGFSDSSGYFKPVPVPGLLSLYWLTVLGASLWGMGSLIGWIVLFVGLEDSAFLPAWARHTTHRAVLMVAGLFLIPGAGCALALGIARSRLMRLLREHLRCGTCAVAFAEIDARMGETVSLRADCLRCGKREFFRLESGRVLRQPPP